MILLGIVLLIIGAVTGLALFWTIGLIVLVAGLVLVLLGAIGHPVGGRRYWWLRECALCS